MTPSIAVPSLFSLRAICLSAALLMGPTLAIADDVTDVQSILASGKAAEGLKKVDQLLLAKPTDPRLRLQRGIALSLLNRPAEAIVVFQKLIETHPELPGPYNNLAVLYGNQGDYEKARQALELAIRTNPTYATAFQNLGDVYARMAGQAYKKALALDKSDASLPLKLAVVQNVFEASVDPRAPKATATATAAAAAAKPVAPAPAPVAVAAPAPAPAPVIAASAAPVAKPVKPAEPTKADATESDKQAVEKAMREWAKAWSARNMTAYFDAYAPDFKGKAASRKAWEQDRRERITGKKKINVTLSDLRIKVNGNQASVRLRQDYSSDALSVKSSKNFELLRNKAGDWQITQESSS